MYRLRPANHQDEAIIRRMIRQAKINPMGLDWRRFVLAVTETDEIVGCGQLKPHPDGSIELASIAVIPAHQRRGVARMIIEHLIARQPPPLYLMCRSVLRPFYEQFGFRVLQEAEMPPYFKRLVRLFKPFARLAPKTEGPLIMRRTG